jgi:hypothetical protein
MFEWLRRQFGFGKVVVQKHPEQTTVATVPTSTAFWMNVESSGLSQGDFLSSCLVPNFPADFGKNAVSNEVQIAKADLIVITQSCDLENNKVAFVALCPIYSLPAFEAFNTKFKNRREWEQVRQGRREGLYLLPSPTNPDNNVEALVVDFRQIISLPIGYLIVQADSIGPRWRLRSPYLEHFSQAFARFFMRVGLPLAIPAFK